jgi:hypothetical protein
MTLPVIFSAASLVFCGFFFIYFRDYLKRRIGREEIFSDYREEVEKLVADIDAATERDLTLIENRLKILKETIDTADRRIAVLVRELERKKTSGDLYTSLGKHAGKKPDPAVPAADSGRMGDPAGHAPGIAEAENAPVVNVIPAETPGQPELPDLPAAGSAKSVGEKAVELAAAGFSPELIASRLGISVSEVDLAITIHRR